MKAILFLGYTGSGKTTAITTVARILKRRRKNVATVKHVHHSNFTIDTQGKDTWLHARAGASTVVVLAPKELTVIWKRDTTKMKLDGIMTILKKEGIDYVLVEGLHRKLSARRDVTRVLCAASRQQAQSYLRNMRYRPICIVGKIASDHSGAFFSEIPLIDIKKNATKLLKLVG